jgi:hypothetical protein
MTDPKLDPLATEWGVQYERSGNWKVTVCESEEAAQALQAASGGEVVSRKTYYCSW